MKIIILTVIALIIPLFFAFIFVLGTYNRLAILRRRCQPTPPDTLADGGISSAGGPEKRRRAVEEYNAARGAFPASIIAALFGFAPLEEPGNGQSSSYPS